MHSGIKYQTQQRDSSTGMTTGCDMSSERYDAAAARVELTASYDEQHRQSVSLSARS